jgi:hypothetical protein
MRIALGIPLASLFALAGAPTTSFAEAKKLEADEIVARVVEADPLGLSGAEINARVTVTEKSGKTRALSFEAKSRRHAPPLAKSLITFNAPADVAGMKFLQIQNKDADDERFLYTPELRRSRRIAGTTRGESFMGTDFSYADLDARDLRQSKATLKPEETVGKLECHRLEVVPKSTDSVYGKIDLWVRKDNFVPVKWVMFDKKGAAVKTLVAREMQRLHGRWFITSSRMTDQTTGRATDLVFEKVERKEEIPEASFSVRAIEQR